MKVRTTLLLRKDLVEKLKRKFGKKKVSEAVNEILAKELMKKNDMFGVDKGMKTFVREHKDRF